MILFTLERMMTMKKLSHYWRDNAALCGSADEMPAEKEFYVTCDACLKILAKEMYEANFSEGHEPEKTACKSCGKDIPAGDYYWGTSAYDYCKDCMSNEAKRENIPGDGWVRLYGHILSYVHPVDVFDIR